jgi:hypothetical protein
MDEIDLDPHYYGIGLVTVAATRLEMLACEVGMQAGAKFRPFGWPDVLGNPGAVLRGLKQIADRHPLNELLQEFIVETERLFNERNRLVHSFLVVSNGPLGPTEGEVELGWRFFHPKSGEIFDPLSQDEYAALAMAIRAQSDRAVSVARILADSPRTERTGNE